MQFEFTEEQKMIRNMMADFAAEHGRSERVREAMDSVMGYDNATWQSLSGDLGLAGLLVNEACGGQGLSAVEMALAFEQLGRFLIPSPLLATGVLGTILLSEFEQDEARYWLGKITTGGCRVSLVDAKLGVAEFVLGAHTADLVLLHIRAGSKKEGTLYAIPAPTTGDVPGLEIMPLTMLDQTRPMARVEVGAQSLLDEYKIAAGNKVGIAIEKALQYGRLAIAAEAIGAAQECLERTVAYAQERIQFGRAIGSFQAIKHQLADMMVAIEAAISAVYFAACTVAETPAQLPRMSAFAKVQASEALSHCAGRMIQLHGGIGFTWEHDAHLYFKRARGTTTLFGTNAALDQDIAASIGLGEWRVGA